MKEQLLARVTWPRILFTMPVFTSFSMASETDSQASYTCPAFIGSERYERVRAKLSAASKCLLAGDEEHGRSVHSDVVDQCVVVVRYPRRTPKPRTRYHRVSE